MQSLDLRKAELLPKGNDALFEAIQTHRLFLRTFSFEGHTLVFNEMFVQLIPQLSELKELDLSGHTFEKSSQKIFASNLGTLVKLKALNLCQTKFVREGVDPFSNISKLTKLEVLNLDQASNLTCESLLKSSLSLKNLKSISFNPILTAPFFSGFSSWTQFSSWTKLEHFSLSLEHYIISSCVFPYLEGLSEAMQHWENLKRFSLFLPLNIGFPLSTGLLDSYRNTEGDTEIQKIMAALPIGLEELTLALPAGVVNKLTNHFTAMPHLRSLNLMIDLADESTITPLINALHQMSPCFKSLNLRAKIMSPGAQALLNQTLSDLNIRGVISRN